MVPVIGSLVAFVVALLVGGLAIYVAASVVADVEDYSHAILTALVGAIAWALTAWIPLFGPLLALIAWVWVINWRYPGGWINAGLIGLIAWIAALAILFVLNAVFGLGVGAFGVPGV
ncbi:hypothetical protein [Natronorubrum bangense]|uniref:Yip1 domain-containing protein n=2 Tax=Natronorubrum bangense TaxID=61858 RepID=L9WJB6_9EURY|nr:hypothetical protein [Natronorubrum bangense]ELY48448.1 hypothetical protein C494_11050 [Natronorubrum bangense JCM 10635]QCC53783.1 hypothetical protein DV706_04330 [Natronorubrum bangense]